MVTGSGELIWDVVNQKVKLEDIPDSDLPLTLQGKTVEQRKTFVADQVSRRKDLQIRVDELSKQRDAHVKVEMTKLAESGIRDSFDKAIAEMIHIEAKRLGIDYDISVQQ